MESNTVKDQTELSEVTRPILIQEDGANSNFPNIDNDTINNAERTYKTECEEKVSDQIKTNMTINAQSAEGGLINSNSEESEIPKKDVVNKMPDQNNENFTVENQRTENGLETRSVESGLETQTAENRLEAHSSEKELIRGNSEDSGHVSNQIEESIEINLEERVIHTKDKSLKKHVEDAPLTYVDEDDGLMKIFGKVCGVKKENLYDEDFKPFTNSSGSKYNAMGRTASGEGGFDEVKLKSIHLHIEKRVGERLACRDDINIVMTESENERTKFDEKRAHADFQSKEAKVSGDVRGHVPYDTKTKEDKERLYSEHVQPRLDSKEPHSRTGTHRGQRSMVRENDDVYDFSHSQRGYMLTIVNDQFVRQTPRDGAKWDLLKMKEIARKFGFRTLNPNQGMNLTKEQILRWLNIARRVDHSGCDCFMLMISTHGQEQMNAMKGGQVDHALVCADDQLIFTSTILDMFNDTNCPTLKGKPKIFYIQACRGGKLDHGGKVFVAYPKNEDKTCGVSAEEESGRKGRESMDESDTNYGEDSWLFHHEYGAGGYTGSQTSSSASHHTAPTQHHNITSHTAPTPSHTTLSTSSHVRVSGPPQPSSQQYTSVHPSSSRSYSSQRPNYQQATFMVPKVSKSTQPKVLHAPGHMVNKIYAPQPYAIVDTPSLKCDNDMLIMYAIPPGMFAWRNTSEGSWMIDYLHRVLMAYDMKRPKNFLNLMTKVIALMSRRTTNTPSAPAMHEKKAVSVIEHKLEKDIFFKQKGPGSDWVKKSKTFAL